MSNFLRVEFHRSTTASESGGVDLNIAEEQPTSSGVAIEENRRRLSSESDLDEFLALAEEIHVSNLQIRSNVDVLNKLHSSLLSTSDNIEINKNLEEVMENTKRLAFSVRSRLDNIAPVYHEGDGDRARIRRTRHSSLFADFVESMRTYTQVKNDFREKCKQRIRRQLKITGRSVTEEELEKMLATGNVHLLTKSFSSRTRKEAKQSTADIEARQADIKKLENSIRELHQLFVEMMLIAEDQSNLVERIEDHVLQGTEYVSPTAPVNPARRRGDRLCRRMFIYAILATVVVSVVIILIIYFILKYAFNITNF